MSRADYDLLIVGGGSGGITAVFTDPELARLGMTEDEARERHRSVRVYRYPFASNDRARIEGQTPGMVKLVCLGLRNPIVGAHIVGSTPLAS